MLIRALLGITFLGFTHAETNITADVEALIAKFAELQQEPEDIIDSIERLGEDSKELFRLGKPVEGLLIDSMNTTWEETNEEERALTEIHKLFDFPNATEPVYKYGINMTIYDVNKMMSSLTGPDRNISDGERILSKIKRIVDNVFIDTEFELDPYYSLGYKVHEPFTIYNTANMSTLFNCRQLTDGEKARFTKVQEALKRLESRNKKKLPRYYSDIDIDDFKTVSIRAPDVNVDKIVEMIDNVNDVTHDRLYQSLHEIRLEVIKSDKKGYRHIDKCTNGTTFVVNEPILRNELVKMRSDLLRLVLVKSMTGPTKPEMYYSGPPANYNETEAHLKALDKAGKTIADWARDLQQL